MSKCTQITILQLLILTLKKKGGEEGGRVFAQRDVASTFRDPVAGPVHRMIVHWLVFDVPSNQPTNNANKCKLVLSSYRPG